jgi:Ca2+/Na+ antiporter
VPTNSKRQKLLNVSIFFFFGNQLIVLVAIEVLNKTQKSEASLSHQIVILLTLVILVCQFFFFNPLRVQINFELLLLLLFFLKASLVYSKKSIRTEQKNKNFSDDKI